MKRVLLGLTVFLLATQAAFAQNGAPIPVTGTAVLPKSCPIVSTDASGLPYCSAMPAAGTGGCSWLTTSFVDNPHPLAAADNCHTRIYKGTGAAQIQVPAAATIGPSFIACYQAETAPLTFVQLAGGKFEGSALAIAHGDQPACLQVDGDGVWDIEGGAAAVAINPNSPQ